MNDLFLWQLPVLFACSDDAVACYKRDGKCWKYDRTLGNNQEAIFSMSLSHDEKFLVATVALGYKVWNLQTDRMLHMKLPTGIRYPSI